MHRTNANRGPKAPVCAVQYALSRQFDQQLVQTLHIRGRVFQAVTGSQRRLIKENVRKIAETVFALLGIQLLDQRVRRVDLEDGLGVRHFLPTGFENLAHLQAQVLFANGQNGRRVGQTMGYAHFTDVLTQRGFEALQQTFLALGHFFLGFLVLFGVQFAQVQIATGDIDKLLPSNSVR